MLCCVSERPGGVVNFEKHGCIRSIKPWGNKAQKCQGLRQLLIDTYQYFACLIHALILPCFSSLGARWAGCCVGRRHDKGKV
ncbi:hypothetical protein C8F00_2068 [Xanthomonas vasicola]